VPDLSEIYPLDTAEPDEDILALLDEYGL